MDGPAVFAVDHHFAFAVQVGEVRVRQHIDGVAQARFRRMAVLQRFGQVARQIEIDGAAVGGVENVQAVVDAQDGQSYDRGTRRRAVRPRRLGGASSCRGRR